jgi:lipoprotein-anchoring transpeptidase ErfK/SrfK
MFGSQRIGRRTVLGTMVLGTVGTAVLAACGRSVGGHAAEDKPAAPKVEYQPGGDKPVSPTAKIAVTVTGGHFGQDVQLVNADSGKQVKLDVAADGNSVTVAEPLGYGAKYKWSGSATGAQGTVVHLDGQFATVSPQDTISVVINIADDAEVGIAAPIILKFSDTVNDKAAVEKALTVTTTPPTEGSWAWLAEDNGSRAHWRPKQYWQPGTQVNMVGKLYGLDYGDGAYGDADVTSRFKIGRSQIVKAVATSHRIQVMRGNQVLLDFPCSYGEADLPRNVTRSGIHVVSEKHDSFRMSNAAAGYFNVLERWAVRISNNGEFIHANPGTVGEQGSTNVTNGCINLSLDAAEQYYNTAIYGDPVEVTGTSIQLSEADGDIYDWIYDWPTWKSMSALK